MWGGAGGRVGRPRGAHQHALEAAEERGVRGVGVRDGALGGAQLRAQPAVFVRCARELGRHRRLRPGACEARARFRCSNK